jgi:hypothetical protein
VEWEARVEPCSDRVRHMLDDHANALYALLDALWKRGESWNAIARDDHANALRALLAEGGE